MGTGCIKILKFSFKVFNALKAFSDKNAILVFAFKNTPTFYALQMNFRSRIFSGVYHSQATRDEKVGSVLLHGEHDLRKKFGLESSSEVRKMLGCL